jgi:hypothetical protein
MALQKSFTLPGTNYTATYIRVDRIDINQEVFEAIIRLGLYADKTIADTETARPYPFGLAKFSGDSFKTYFTRSNIASAATNGKTVHGIAYDALKDAVTAYKANPLTYLALIQNDFGGVNAFDGVTDV